MLQIIRQVRQAGLGSGAVQSDGADEQAHLILLHGKDPRNAGADSAAGGICFRTLLA
jgi:hypothetical protein